MLVVGGFTLAFTIHFYTSRQGTYMNLNSYRFKSENFLSVAFINHHKKNTVPFFEYRWISYGQFCLIVWKWVKQSNPPVCGAQSSNNYQGL